MGETPLQIAKSIGKAEVIDAFGESGDDKSPSQTKQKVEGEKSPEKETEAPKQSPRLDEIAEVSEGRSSSVSLKCNASGSNKAESEVEEEEELGPKTVREFVTEVRLKL